MKHEKENEAAAAEATKKSAGLANTLIIMMSLVFVAMSVLMIVAEDVEIIYLCYGICGAAIIAGIYMIVKYFMTDAYRNVNAYGFSLGTLLVILGICGMVRAQAMAGGFVIILGIILLLSGITVLQHSLDLRRMEDVIWIAVIIIAALILLCGIMVVIRPFADKIFYETAVWWMMLVAGVLGVVTNIYTMIRVGLFKRSERKKVESEKNKTESGKNQERASDMSKKTDSFYSDDDNRNEGESGSENQEKQEDKNGEI